MCGMGTCEISIPLQNATTATFWPAISLLKVPLCPGTQHTGTVIGTMEERKAQLRQALTARFGEATPPLSEVAFVHSYFVHMRHLCYQHDACASLKAEVFIATR